MKYRKKPVVIEAVKYDGGREQLEDPQWCVDAIKKGIITFSPNKIMLIKTLEGVMQGNLGDYIIQGVNGELYPCKPDIFHKTYETVD